MLSMTVMTNAEIEQLVETESAVFSYSEQMTDFERQTQYYTAKTNEIISVTHKRTFGHYPWPESAEVRRWSASA